MIGAVKDKLNNRKGFTLPEMLVALGIAVILLGLGLLAAVQYGDDLKRLEMDVKARQMFLVAQNRMAAADATGELRKFVAANAGSADKLGEGMIKRPSDMDASGVAGLDNGDYYYITYNPGDADTLAGSILKYMLPFGAINDALRTKGSYIIEYNINNAFIYGVFYTESESGLTYENVTELNAAGGRANTREGEKIRSEYRIGGQKAVVGYYGGTSAVNLEENTVATPVIKVENGDILKVEIFDPNYFHAPEEATSMLLTTVTLSIKGRESGQEEKMELLLDGDLFAPTKAVGQPEWWDVTNDSIMIDGENRECLKYTLQLDDISIPEGHFAAKFPEMIPGEDIAITAEVVSRTSSLGNSRDRVIVNSLFDQVVLDGTALDKEIAIAKIGCIRHLENLDPNVSGLPEALAPNDEERPITHIVRRAEQVRDLDWNAFPETCPSGDIRAHDTSALLAADSYHGISNSMLLSYAGLGENPVAIKNITIRPSGSGGHAGIFRAVEGLQKLTVSNLKLENINIAASATGHAGGLIGVVSGEGQVEVNGVNATGLTFNLGTGNSGGLIGAVTGKGSIGVSEVEINDLNFTNDDSGDIGGLIGHISCTAGAPRSEIRGVLLREMNTVVATNAHIGGLIGHITGASNVLIKECATAGFNMERISVGSSGGIIGRIAGNAAVQVKDSYSAGGVAKGAYAGVQTMGEGGGIVGAIDASVGEVKFEQCYSTCSVKGIVAGGGFVGADHSAQTLYEDCYVAGFVEDPIEGESIAGNFAGSMRGGTIRNVYFLAGINDLDEIGTGYYTGYKENEEEEADTIQAKTGEEMTYENSLSTETHPFALELSNQKYPFRPVNKTGATLAESEGVHYGDWPF